MLGSEVSCLDVLILVQCLKIMYMFSSLPFSSLVFLLLDAVRNEGSNFQANSAKRQRGRRDARSVRISWGGHAQVTRAGWPSISATPLPEYSAAKIVLVQANNKETPDWQLRVAK